MPTRQPSLIERMGGAEAASGLLISSVEIFYHKLVSDPELKRFFDGRDIEKLKSKQVEFLAYVFGGPEAYNGKGIFEAHEHLIRDEGLTEVHFDIVAAHFRDTLFELGASQDLIEEALNILSTARPIFEQRLPSTKTTETETTETAAAVGRDSSAHGGFESTSSLAGQLQAVLLTSDIALNKTRQEVREMVCRTDPVKVERLRSALRLRGPGLVELLDQALATGVNGSSPVGGG